MNWQTIIDPALSGRLCMTLLHSLWQVALLAVVARGIEWLWARRSPERGYAICVAAIFMALAALPITYMVVEVQPAATQSAADISKTGPVIPLAPTGTESASAVPPSIDAGLVSETVTLAMPSTVDQDAAIAIVQAPSIEFVQFSPWIALLYAIGVLAMLLRLAGGVFRAHQLAARAQVISDGPFVQLLHSLARGWSMRVVPALACAENVVVPKVVGFVRPTILVPASAITGLSTDELAMVLAHELAHIKRYDMWVNLVQRLAESLLFFNPALWYLSHRISATREFCCDELTCGVMAKNYKNPRAQYAWALLRVVELSRSVPDSSGFAALAASGRSPSELRRRVARLFGEPLREPLRLSRGGVLTVALLAAFAVCGPLTWKSVADDDSTPADAEQEVADTKLGDFPDAVGMRIAQVLSDSGISFLTPERIAIIEFEFKDLVARTQPKDLSDDRKRAILAAISTYGAEYLGLDRFRADDLRSFNMTYLKLPDLLLTLQWKIYRAIKQPPLSDNDARRVSEQRTFIQDKILDEANQPRLASLRIRSQLETLERVHSDPLWPFVNQPMTDEQFALFKKKVAEADPNSGWDYVYIREATRILVPDFPDYDLPFDEKVISSGYTGINFQLGFESNAGNQYRPGDIISLDKELHLADVDSGIMQRGQDGIPKPVKTAEQLRAWLNEQRGDLCFFRNIEQSPQYMREALEFELADRTGPQLIGLPGVKLAPLGSITNWFEADNVSNETLRKLLDEKGERIHELAAMKRNYERDKVSPDDDWPGGYFAVLTKNGRLAVIQVYQFEGSTIHIKTRPRVTKPAVKPAAKQQAAPQDTTVPIKIVVAKHVMLLEGRQIISWNDLNAIFAAMPNPRLVHPTFYTTGGARELGMTPMIKDEIFKLHKKFNLQGHSEATLWPRTDLRFDRIKDASDLAVDESLRAEGKVVDSEGKPVAGAEVVLVTPVDESIQYRTVHIELVQGRVRNPLENMNTVSDADGKFALHPPKDTPYYIVVLQPDAGFALTRSDQFLIQGEIKLLPWSGLVSELAEEPGREQQADVTTTIKAADGRPEIIFNQYWSDLKHDKPTRVFGFTHIPPIVQVSISRSFPGDDGGATGLSGASVGLLPGETRRLDLGPLTPQQRELLRELQKMSQEKPIPNAAKPDGKSGN